jgi:hypothetical protein
VFDEDVTDKKREKKDIYTKPKEYGYGDYGGYGNYSNNKNDDYSNSY